MLLIITLFLFSCYNPEVVTNKYATIQEILKDSLNVKPYNKILVLTEEGCLGCNKSYALLIEGMLNSDALIVITATGTSVDISQFSESKFENIIYDYKNYFKRNQILSTSGAIFLSENKIDTIITINAKELEYQLNAIKKRALN